MKSILKGILGLSVFVMLYSCTPVIYNVQQPAPVANNQPAPVVNNEPAPVGQPATVVYTQPSPQVVQQGPPTYQTFYDDLSPYGTWINYSPYGYVWAPNLGYDFTPYSTNG